MRLIYIIFIVSVGLIFSPQAQAAAAVALEEIKGDASSKAPASDDDVPEGISAADHEEEEDDLDEHDNEHDAAEMKETDREENSPEEHAPAAK